MTPKGTKSFFLSGIPLNTAMHRRHGMGGGRSHQKEPIVSAGLRKGKEKANRKQ